VFQKTLKVDTLKKGDAMPKRILPLTDLQVKTAKPKAKEYKLTDGGGLYLLITPSGGKLWRFNYRFDEKYKTLFLKSYPEITLSDARKARDDARKLLANGVDPSAVIKAQKEQTQIQSEISANTFKKVAREWLQKNAPAWSESHIKTITSRLERDVYGIQSNIYGLKGQDIFIFNIFDITRQRYLPVAPYRTLLDDFGLKGVPVVAENFQNVGFDHARFLEYAEGKSLLNPQAEREGVVFPSIDETRSNQGKISFKAISNKYLLKHGG
jgi:hypothetical protein